MDGLKERWGQRSRPLPPGVIYAKQHFEQIWSADGSVLEGQATDLVAYLVAPENRDLGVVKSIRKPLKTFDFSADFYTLPHTA